MRYCLLLIVLAAMTLPCLLMAGCNTVMGMGKDIHDSAQNVKTWIDRDDDTREQLSDSSSPSRR